ncbi:MAG: hypothetical protein GF399_06120 [Candidatus Coatesbacteria bacterium]|nr:hypothetical protein [Candidatus Coatesbacteria bacterium]
MIPDYSGHDAVYYNDGNGVDEEPGWLAADELDSWHCFPLDVDADGDQDILLAGQSVALFTNTGTGLESEPSWRLFDEDHWIESCAVVITTATATPRSPSRTTLPRFSICTIIVQACWTPHPAGRWTPRTAL